MTAKVSQYRNTELAMTANTSIGGNAIASILQVMRRQKESQSYVWQSQEYKSRQPDTRVHTFHQLAIENMYFLNSPSLIIKVFL